MKGNGCLEWKFRGVDLNWFDYCVQSILSQTYDNFELILVNDGSDDNSLEICRKWEKR